jgi:Fe-S cluster assembly protein SufD
VKRNPALQEKDRLDSMNTIQKKIINKTQTIVTSVSEGDTRLEYSINAGVNVTIILTSFHAKKADVNLSVTLAATGATAKIIGIFLGSKSSDISLHTLQTHQAPDTTSNLLIKSVLPDEATFIYSGSIRVEKTAQKTDAYQRNENLLTGIGAHAVSSPTLEILANDVRCTHGSTTGPISPEELWYLESRGISELSAKQLMTEGHLASAVNLIDDVETRNQLWQKIHAAI